VTINDIERRIRDQSTPAQNDIDRRLARFASSCTITSVSEWIQAHACAWLAMDKVRLGASFAQQPFQVGRGCARKTSTAATPI